MIFTSTYCPGYYVRIKRFIFLFGFIFQLNAYCQDIHFSQFSAASTYLNPANNGVFDGDYRLAGSYRNQYRNITVGYNSINLAGDTRFKFKKHLVGVGIDINSDKAGDSRFGGNKIAVALNYIRQLTKDSVHFIAIGLQPGIATRGINTGALTLDNQYNGDAYDASLPGNENFNQTNVMFADLSAGITWSMKKNKRSMALAGIAFHHFNNPKRAFITENPVLVSPKILIHGSLTKQLNIKLDLVPELLYSRQNKFNEVVFGSWLKYWLSTDGVIDNAVYGGLFYRFGDALIAAVAMDYKSFRVGLSYDFTLSALKTANRVRGGIEVSVVYIFRKPPPFTIKNKGCPAWM